MHLRDRDLLENALNHCIDAFEKGGGCGHDLGLHGAFAVVREWERLRTRQLVALLWKDHE